MGTASDYQLCEEDFLRVHLPGYLGRLKSLPRYTPEKLRREAEQYDTVYLTRESVVDAKAASTALCGLVSRVLSGALDNGFAVVRPPGHHAQPGVAGGYCIINNIAVAASHARHCLGAGRVLIVDWDVHHGDGTQAAFIGDPDVLYFSVHRHDGGRFFPFASDGGPATVGTGDGAGSNVNVAWSGEGAGDDEYRAVWDLILLPIASVFRPDLVLVSAGFDCAEGDVGGCTVTPACFADLTRKLLGMAEGKVVCALEGGYVPSVLGVCLEAVVAALLDKEGFEGSQRSARVPPSLEATLKTINPSAARSIRSTISHHKKYWGLW